MGSGKGKTRRARRVHADPRLQALVDHDYDRFLSLHGHEDALAAFISIQDSLDGEEYWRLLRGVWVRAEQVQPRDTWKDLLSQHSEWRATMMTDEERADLASLPDQVMVYRGVGNPEHTHGFSWTLDRQRAEWFAYRFLGAPLAAMFRLTNFDPQHRPEPTLITGQVAHADVIAYLQQRDEEEIVALPENVAIKSVKKMAPLPGA